MLLNIKKQNDIIVSVVKITNQFFGKGIIMKKSTRSFLAMLLALIMLVGVLASCSGTTPGQTTEKPSENTTEKNDDKTTSSPAEDATEAPSSSKTEAPTSDVNTEDATQTPTETSSEAPSETPTEDSTEDSTEDVEGPQIESPYMDSIVKANELANGVQQYYEGLTRWFSNNGQTCYIENLNMDLSFLREGKSGTQYIEYIKNKEDGAGSV